MTAQEILNRICGEYTAVNIHCTVLDRNHLDDVGELAYEFTAAPNVKINVTLTAITATLVFDTRQEYKEFLGALKDLENLEAPDGFVKANIIALSPFQDDLGGEQIFAGGPIGEYAYNDPLMAVRFVFQPDDFEVYSLDLEGVDEELAAQEENKEEDWLDDDDDEPESTR